MFIMGSLSSHSSKTIPYSKKAFLCPMEVLIRTVTKLQCRLGTFVCGCIANQSFVTIVKSALDFLKVRYFILILGIIL